MPVRPWGVGDGVNTSWYVAYDYPISNPRLIADRRPPPKLQFLIDKDDLTEFGEGCAGSSGSAPGLGMTGSARIGDTTRFFLSNAPPGSNAVLALGFSHARPLPIDLTPIGMTDCRLYVDVAVPLPVQSDAAGVGARDLPIPSDPALVSAHVYGQLLVPDPGANPLGLTVTNYGRVLVGL